MINNAKYKTANDILHQCTSENFKEILEFYKNIFDYVDEKDISIEIEKYYEEIVIRCILKNFKDKLFIIIIRYDTFLFKIICRNLNDIVHHKRKEISKTDFLIYLRKPKWQRLSIS